METHKPKIYVFSGMRNGGDGICYAMAEDGTVLGSHWCSSEGWAVNDLGVQEGARPDRHETYAKHYPAGYKMEFVPAREIEGHAGLQRAMQLNDAHRQAGAHVKGQDVRESGARLVGKLVGKIRLAPTETDKNKARRWPFG